MIIRKRSLTALVDELSDIFNDDEMERNLLVGGIIASVVIGAIGLIVRVRRKKR